MLVLGISDLFSIVDNFADEVQEKANNPETDVEDTTEDVPEKSIWIDEADPEQAEETIFRWSIRSGLGGVALGAIFLLLNRGIPAEIITNVNSWSPYIAWGVFSGL